MNTVGLALKRAVVTAKNRRELSAAFDREWAAVEFSPEAESVVVAVPEDAARRWARAELSDLDLILAMNGDTSAIWWAGLPGIRHFARGRRVVEQLHQSGARIIVMQTHNPVIIEHGARIGFTIRELENGLCRLIAEPPVLDAWLSHPPTP